MSSIQLTQPQYRADIDGLRAVAVLLVICFHAFPLWFKGGFIGVDIFFVISGFLISSIIFDNLHQGNFRFRTFYARRIKRIFPALLLVLISCFIYGWFALLADEYQQLGKHITAGASFISNFIFWKESGYFDTAAETKPLLHLWSLGIEEQFYIIWPFFLWLAWKKKYNWLLLTLTIAAMSFILNITGVKQDSIATFYSPLTRFWELLLGSILAYVNLHHRHLFSNKNQSILSYIGAVLISCGILFVTKASYFPGFLALLPTLGCLCLIAAGANAPINRFILSHRILVWVGLISFPLYLWHWPLLSFAHLAEYETPSRLIRLGLLALSILFAWLTYQYIEKPIRFGKFGNTRILTVVMIMVGFLGVFTYKQQGFQFRFPTIINSLSNFDYDSAAAYRARTCFLGENQGFKAFAQCKTLIDAKKKTILIWGDSHAAQLYRGFEAVFGKEFNIVQRNASACPPILNLDIHTKLNVVRPHCLSINKGVFNYIQSIKPYKVVLAANWALYEDKQWAKLATTINQLKQIGIESIDLIGPVPQWQHSLPKQLCRFMKKHPSQSVPTRMHFGLKPGIKSLEPALKQLAAKEHINYFSPFHIFCTNKGCITRLGQTADSVTAWDYGHLTKQGSIYLVSNFVG